MHKTMQQEVSMVNKKGDLMMSNKGSYGLYPAVNDMLRVNNSKAKII